MFLFDGGHFFILHNRSFYFNAHRKPLFYPASYRCVATIAGFSLHKENNRLNRRFVLWRRHPDLNRGMRFCRPGYPLGAISAIKKQCEREFWSGRRRFEPATFTLQGEALPLSPLPIYYSSALFGGSYRARTCDTACRELLSN